MLNIYQMKSDIDYSCEIHCTEIYFVFQWTHKKTSLAEVSHFNKELKEKGKNNKKNSQSIIRAHMYVYNSGIHFSNGNS